VEQHPAGILGLVLAVLYDIHGNLPALEAVLDDARGANVDRFVLGGDYTAFGAWPIETLARLDELEPATWIRGNWDRWLDGDAAPDMPDDPTVQGAAEHARSALDGAVLARLGALPATATIDDILFCHASPGSDTAGFAADEDDPGSDARLVDSVTEELVVCGHTHVQFDRHADGLRLINPGSVGLPLDGDPRAAYALIASPDDIELRRVAYDEASAADALRQIGDDWAEAVAARLLAAGAAG
jgi:putative phosphoesterase